MKKLFITLFICAASIWAQGGCYPQGNCTFGDPGVECYLFDQERYPSSDCPSTPGCPGIKDVDIYYCYQYDEPCGSVICTGCEECVSGKCPGTHVAMNLTPILAAFLPESLKTLHEKAWGNGLHGFRGKRAAFCSRKEWKHAPHQLSFKIRVQLQREGTGGARHS